MSLRSVLAAQLTIVLASCTSSDNHIAVQQARQHPFVDASVSHLDGACACTPSHVIECAVFALTRGERAALHGLYTFSNPVGVQFPGAALPCVPMAIAEERLKRSIPGIRVVLTRVRANACPHAPGILQLSQRTETNRLTTLDMSVKYVASMGPGTTLNVTSSTTAAADGAVESRSELEYRVPFVHQHTTLVELLSPFDSESGSCLLLLFH